MFKRLVETTPLYNEDANLAFTNITGDVYRGDSVFLSTMRALLTPERIGEDSVYLKITNKPFYESVDDAQILTEKLGIKKEDIAPNTIYIINISVRQKEIVDGIFKMLLDEIAPAMEKDGWVFDDRIAKFFQSAPRVISLTNAEHKSTLVIAPALGAGQYHFVAAGMPRYFPWYFPQPDPKLTPQEMSLLQSLTPENEEELGTTYLNILKEMAKKYDFRTTKITKLLKGFSVQTKRRTMESTLSNIRNIESRLESLLRQYRELLESKQKDETFLTGLKCEIAKDEESCELVDYFKCHPNLTLISASDGNMKFEARGYLSYFDEEGARTYIENRDSDWYYPNNDDGSDYIPTDDMAKLLTAIFIDQTLKLRVCAAYNLSGTNVYAMDSSEYSKYTYECDEYLPNPHHWYHSCISTHGDKMHESLCHGDYIGAIEQGIASAITFNVHDSTVMDEFMSDLYGLHSGRDMPCIETPDGAVLTPKEAIQWLKDQEAKHE